MGQHVYECPTARPPDGKTDGPPVTVREGLGFDPDGRLTWFDGSSGEVLAKEELRPEAAEALTRDVTYDPWQHRALVFESDAEDQGGAIAVHPMAATEPGFEARRHWAWVDGRARLMALPYALLSFEEGHGERWKVLRDDGVPTVSVAAPRPASAWLEPTGDGYRVAALVHQPTDDATLRQWLTATVSSSGVQLNDTVPLGQVGTGATSARMAPARSRGGVFVADLRHGELTLSHHDHDGVRRDGWRLGAAADRIEQLVNLDPPGAARERVAVLLSGPSQLVVADIDRRGAEASRLSLAGGVTVQDRFFGRDMVGQGPDRILVATDAGVVAVHVVDAPDEPPALALDPSFGGARLRGPLAAIGD